MDFNVVDVKFTKGQDTRTQRKLLLPGKWDKLVNYALSEDNTPKRRDGAVAHFASGGNSLIARNNEMLQLVGGQARAISASQTNEFAAVPGQLPFVGVSKHEVDFTSGFHDSVDVAYGNGFLCYVWRDWTSAMVATGVRCTLIEVSSGARLVAASSITTSATAISPRVVFADDAFFLFFNEPGVGTSCAVIETSAPTVVGTPVAAADASIQARNIDAAPYAAGGAGNGTAWVAYVSNNAADSVRGQQWTRVGSVATLASANVQLVTQANVPNAEVWGLALRQFDDTGATDLIGLFLIKSGGGGAVADGAVGVVFDGNTLAVTTAATSISTAAAPAVAGACHITAVPTTLAGGAAGMLVFADQQSSYLTAAIRPLQGIAVDTTLAVAADLVVTRSACYRVNGAEASGPQGPFIAGKAFSVSVFNVERQFLPVCMLENYFGPGANTNTKSSQCSFFLLDVSGVASLSVGVLGAQPVASALYRTLGLRDPTLSGAAPPVTTPCTAAGPLDDGSFVVGLQERGALQLVGLANVTPVGVSGVRLTPNFSSGPVSGQLGEVAFSSGGQLGAYDGRQILQHGFPLFPEGISCVVSAPGTGFLTPGVHQLVSIYEWVDGSGNRIQSAPSLPVTVTVVNATDIITVLTPTTQLAQMAGYNTSVSTLVIVVYMTLAGGLTFYRTSQSSVIPLPNNPAASTVTTVVGGLNNLDATLATNEQLYTQPLLASSTLPNLAPGPVKALAVGRNRLWYLPSDKQNAWGFSQALRPNTGLQFNDALESTVPTEGGDTVAIAMLDEKTIVFCERRIYVVAGNPPNPDGSNNGLSDPIDIQSDVGCSDARSVLVESQDGIIFKSTQGWHLLGRDLSVRYIGAGVAEFDAETVVSAVLMEDRKEARFALANGATLVYSTLLGEWSYFIYGSGNIFGPGTALPADAKWWPALGRYVWTTVLDGLILDTPGAVTDFIGGSTLSISTLARTGFLKVGALEGFQRVRRLFLSGTADSLATLDSTLALTVYFNDSYTGGQTYTANAAMATVAAAMTSAESVDLRHRLHVQKCKSVAFQFSDTPTSTSTTGLNGIQAMALEVGLKKGVRRLPAGATIP